MSREEELNERLSEFERDLASMRPRGDRLDPRWREVLAKEASLTSELLAEREATAQSGLPIVAAHGDAQSCSSGLPRWIGFATHTGIFSHVVSALILCLATLVAWYCSTVDYPRMGHNTLRAIGSKAGFGVVPVVVGRVTAAVDCQWAQDALSPPCLDYVAVGQWIKLDAGLLEITYSAGGKVILQGPASYEVTVDGGFLAAGKLVGISEREPIDGRRIEVAEGDNKRQGDGGSADNGRPVRLIVRTPTYLVLGLGKEFGVKVDRVNGSTLIHAFRGVAALQLPVSVDSWPHKILREGESELFDVTDIGGVPPSRAVSIAPAEFVRRISDYVRPLDDLRPDRSPLPREEVDGFR